MIVGILSDTHNRIDAMAAGLAALRARGAEFYIHCGDVGGQAILDQLAGLPAAFVWGNNDFDRRSLADYAKHLHIDCYNDFADLTLAGKRIAVTHGDDAQIMQRIQLGQQHDYLLYGHTHAAHSEHIGRLHMINPGALYRAARKTVAILDTATDFVTTIPVAV